MDTSTKVTGAALLAQALVKHEVKTAFYLMGGPMFDAENSCIAQGIRMIDLRHEQAAAMMAHAYARVTGKPGVCMACSGPGAINLTTGLAHALVDCVPVVAFGGSSPLSQAGLGAFQEFDQVAVMRPVTKWAERVYDARRIPQYVDMAFAHAIAGKPGPAYLDLPGDVLDQEVDEEAIRWSRRPRTLARPAASAEQVARALEFLERQGMAHRIASISAYVACAGHEENTAPHAAAFLICDCCGATREINGPDQGAMDAAAAAAGYAIARTTIEAHGLCAACRQAA